MQVWMHAREDAANPSLGGDLLDTCLHRRYHATDQDTKSDDA